MKKYLIWCLVVVSSLVLFFLFLFRNETLYAQDLVLQQVPIGQNLQVAGEFRIEEGQLSILKSYFTINEQFNDEEKEKIEEVARRLFGKTDVSIEGNQVSLLIGELPVSITKTSEAINLSFLETEKEFLFLENSRNRRVIDQNGIEYQVIREHMEE